MGFIYCNLRVLMAEKGLNIQNVKDKTTLSRTTISNLYNNYGAGVQFDTMTQLCELLHCEVGDLFKYVNISYNFELLTEEDIEMSIDTHITNPEEGDGFDYVHELSAVLTLKTSFNYNGDKFEFDFYYNYSVNFDEKNNIRFHSVFESDFFDKIEEYNLPYYVIDYLEEKLDQFISNWSLDYIDNTGL